MDWFARWLVLCWKKQWFGSWLDWFYWFINNESKLKMITRLLDKMSFLKNVALWVLFYSTVQIIANDQVDFLWVVNFILLNRFLGIGPTSISFLPKLWKTVNRSGTFAYDWLRSDESWCNHFHILENSLRCVNIFMWADYF